MRRGPIQALSMLAITALAFSSAVGVAAAVETDDASSDTERAQPAEVDGQDVSGSVSEAEVSDVDSLESATSKREDSEFTAPRAATEVQDAPQESGNDTPVNTVNFTFSRYAGADESQLGTEMFRFTGTITCNTVVDPEGCKGLTLTVPVPEADLPADAQPFTWWGIDLIWAAGNQQIAPKWNEDGTAWIFELPSPLSGGEQHTFTLRMQNQRAYQPSEYTFDVQPTLSGSNFDAVTSAPVSYTGTMKDPVVTGFLTKLRPAATTLYPGSEFALQPKPSGTEGLSGGYAAIAPNSGTVVIPLPDGVEFVSSASDDEDSVPAVYDEATNTVTYSKFGLTWKENYDKKTLTFAPLVLKIADDYFDQSSVTNQQLCGSFTGKTISEDPQLVTGTNWCANALTIKENLSTSDVIGAYTLTTEGVSWGNRGYYSAPLPDFLGQTFTALNLYSTTVDYDLEVLWGVPCRSGSGPKNVKIASNPECAINNVAFTLQDLKLKSEYDDLQLPAVITRADGTQENIVITNDVLSVEKSSPVVSVKTTGTVTAGQSARIVYAGVFPEGSMEGTAVDNDALLTNFGVGFQWQAKASRSGLELPTKSTPQSTSRKISFGTGASISLRNVQSTYSEFAFSRFTSSNAGEAQAAVLLPAGLNFTGMSLEENSPVPQVIQDWNGTGQTLLRFTLPADGSYDSIGKINYVAEHAGRYTVATAVTAGTNDFTEDRCWRGGITNSAGPTNVTPGNSNYAGTYVAPGGTGGILNDDSKGSCFFEESFNVRGENASAISAFIKRSDSAVWSPTPGLWWYDSKNHPEGAQPGELVDFRARVQNLAYGSMDDPVVYVDIPSVGAENPVSGSELGTDFPLVMASAVNMPTGWSVEYSLSDNACQPELGVVADCVDDWSATPPASWGDVKSLRFSADEFASNSVADFEYKLQVPTQAEICAVLDKSADCDDYLETVSWNLAALNYQGQSDAGSSYSAQVGIGRFEFADVYQNLSVEVVRQDRGWARSGDTVRFTEDLLRRPNDPGLDPTPVVEIKIHDLGEGASFVEGSLSSGDASFDAASNTVVWEPGAVKDDITSLSFEVVLGDEPPELLAASSGVPAGEDFEFSECEEGVTPWPCVSEASVVIPQVWADLGSDPVSGSTVSLGDRIDYRVDLTEGGIDAAIGALPDPVLTWDVAELAPYGQISGVEASVGSAVYDEDAGLIRWSDIDLGSLGRSGLSLGFTFQSADEILGVDGDEIVLSTVLSAEVGDDFTPVHAVSGWSTEHVLSLVEETVPPVGPPTGPGAGVDGGGDGSEPAGGLAKTGSDLPGVIAIACLLLGIGAWTTKRRSVQ